MLITGLLQPFYGMSRITTSVLLKVIKSLKCQRISYDVLTCYYEYLRVTTCQLRLVTNPYDFLSRSI